MLALASLAQQEIRTAANDVDAMVNEALETIDETELARLSVDDGEDDDAEVGLQLRLLVKIVQHHFGVFAALELEDDAHAIAVALVPDIGNAFEFLFIHQKRSVLDERGFVDLIWDLGNDDRLAVLRHFLGGGAGA